MKESIQRLYKIVKDAQEEMYMAQEELKKWLGSVNDLEEYADAAYALREIHRLATDIRSMAYQAQTLAERIGCVIAVKDEKLDAIKTPWVHATPDIKMMASLPRKNTPEFVSLMQHLGVPAELSEGPQPVIAVNWNGFTEHLSQLMSQGKPLPPGINAEKTYPVYKFNMRKRRGVLEAAGA